MGILSLSVRRRAGDPLERKRMAEELQEFKEKSFS